MKYLFTVLMISISLFCYSQCDNPSKWERNQSYYNLNGWSNLKMSTVDSNVLINHFDTLSSLLCKARKMNHTRVWVKSVPKQVLELNYAKNFICTDNTILIRELIIESGNDNFNQTITQSNLIDEYNLNLDSNLPAHFQSFLLPVDKKVEYSHYGEDFKEVKEYLEFTSGNDKINPFYEYNCYQGELTSLTIPRVEFRFFIDTLGTCVYVDHTTEQSIECTKSMVEKAKNLYQTVKFKPAIKNGKFVNSYILVKFIPWIYSEEEYEKLDFLEQNGLSACFDWAETLEGFKFWSDIYYDKKFKTFYNKYPKDTQNINNEENNEIQEFNGEQGRKGIACYRTPNQTRKTTTASEYRGNGIQARIQKRRVDRIEISEDSFFR